MREKKVSVGNCGLMQSGWVLGLCALLLGATSSCTQESGVAGQDSAQESDPSPNVVPPDMDAMLGDRCPSGSRWYGGSSGCRQGRLVAAYFCKQYETYAAVKTVGGRWLGGFLLLGNVATYGSHICLSDGRVYRKSDGAYLTHAGYSIDNGYPVYDYGEGGVWENEPGSQAGVAQANACVQTKCAECKRDQYPTGQVGWTPAQWQQECVSDPSRNISIDYCSQDNVCGATFRIND